MHLNMLLQRVQVGSEYYTFCYGAGTDTHLIREYKCNDVVAVSVRCRRECDGMS
jgi:hypothetical protein